MTCVTQWLCAPLHIVALSTYLGHSSLSGTYWYLQSTPQLLRDIADAGEAWIKGGAQ
jgi:hypothetical protein